MSFLKALVSQFVNKVLIRVFVRFSPYLIGIQYFFFFYFACFVFAPSSQEFHELSHGLLLWLENIDRRRNEIVPIAAGLDRDTLRAHYRALQVGYTLARTC